MLSNPRNLMHSFPTILSIVIGVSMVIAMVTAEPSTPMFDAYLAHVPAADKISPRVNCVECGVVSSTRSIGQTAEGLNSGIEVTVRMRDGSSLQFTDASSPNWRVGDHMIIIGSAINTTEPAMASKAP